MSWQDAPLTAIGRRIGFVILILVAFGLGYALRWGCAPSAHAPAHDKAEKPTTAAVEKQPEVWYCSMHPHIRRPGPGKCPICHMDLILLPGGEATTEGGERVLVTSAAAKKLMEIRTSPVERRYPTAEIRMVGKVDYDETKLGYITAWVPGRLDRLFVDYTGLTVRKGDHMVEIYSPDLLVAQAELLQALKAVRELADSDVGIMKETTRATVEAARERLRLWGLTKQQIAEIEQVGKPTDHITIYAPMGGVVIAKDAQQGMYVQTGTRIYTIADLTAVWVKLDAYESDLMWLRYGQAVEVVSEAYPGETFSGWIAFIEPVLNPTTRTVKIRVNVPNPEGKLKPNMFVRGVVRARVAAGGRVMDPDLMGKWICPMHPDVVKDGAGICDICEMELVTAEALGYVAVSDEESPRPLVIPVSAALWTGKRAVVYVEAPDTERPTYEGREVVLGPRAGDDYIVRSGLAEGDIVVTNGNFKIDSALQIQAKPSMMSPEGGAPVGLHHHAGGMIPEKPPARRPVVHGASEVPSAFRSQLTKVFDAYLGVHKTLAEDNAEAAKTASQQSLTVLQAVDMTLLEGEEHMAWMKHQEQLQNALEAIEKAKGIEEMRVHFEHLPNTLIESVKTFGTDPGRTVYQLRCPMAFDGRGAYWLQDDEDVRNPYFGAAMLECGEVVHKFE